MPASERAIELAERALEFICECERVGLKPDEIRMNSSDYKELSSGEPRGQTCRRLWGLPVVVDDDVDELIVSGPIP